MYLYPIFLVDALDMRNKYLRFAINLIYPVPGVFHTVEAMYGFSPKGVESSFKRYALYNASIVELQYDPKNNHEPIQATSSYKKSCIITFLKEILITGSYMSLFAPSRYEPFECDVNGNKPGLNLSDCLNWNLFRNNIVGAILIQMMLSTFTTTFSIVVGFIFGVQTSQAMENPMMTSTSPSDFWGNKWNLVIHGALKRGVFKPVYKISSNRSLAVVATFVASALFHEYLIYAVWHRSSHLSGALGDGDDGGPAHWKQTMFMMWNGMIIIVEYLVGGSLVFQWMKRTLPTPLVTALVLSTALPVAHWFIHPYTKGNLFQDFEVAFLLIRRL